MEPPTAVDPSLAHHRALGATRRLDLLGALDGASEPLTAQMLAERMRVHVNTIRFHLGILVEAGLVVEGTTRSAARGRPRHAYRLADDALTREPGGYRLLAEVIVDALARRKSNTDQTLEEAGRIRGRSLVRPRFGDEHRTTVDEGLAWVTRFLESFGFQPKLEQAGKGQQIISMRPCPFGDMASRNAAIVCPVHLGLMRGALEALDAPVEATMLEPFVKPDVCVARFRADADASG